MTALIAPERAALIPEVRKPKAIKLPSVADQTLRNGLRVLAARRPGVPRVEARLVVPTARGDVAPSARIRMATRTLLSGTSKRSSVDIAELLQQIGGNLDANSDEEHVVLTGSALAPDLPVLLDLLAEVLIDASFPDDEVALERARLTQEITLMRSQPETVAREALMKRMFGRHPYGRGLPSPAEVERVKPAILRSSTPERLLPTGSILVLVGDVRPDRAVAAAEEALSGWKADKRAPKPGLSTPPTIKPGATVIIDRPGAVQTNIRMGGPAVNRSHPDFPALALANLVFGGYFVSRLVDNIREKRGYTYSPGSAVQHLDQASYFYVQADVGTEVTGPALVEIRYELERMLAGPIEPSELQSAKRFLAGTLAMSIQTQAGLAGYLAMLASSDLPLEFLRDYPKAVEALDADAVIEASRRHLAPHRLVTTLVGNSEAIEPVAAAFGPVETSAGG
ncbi:MAG TPA: pitrilysin family protein [Acidimicrobiales bacterium]